MRTRDEQSQDDGIETTEAIDETTSEVANDEGLEDDDVVEESEEETP